MNPLMLVSPVQPVTQMLRIGSVSYFNSKPLIYGLDTFDDLDLKLAVPARLIDGLRDASYDIALLPVIDYQRLDHLCLVPSGGIGCDGPTLTVRIFSKKPIDQIETLACDTESHTSVALARVILAESFGRTPRFVELNARADGQRDATAEPDAKLLIGDKVVCEEPLGYAHQLDLGHAWRELTGLPFVFAIWTARRGIDLRDLPERLVTAREEGLKHVGELVSRYAIPRGWPPGMALQYLTVYLKFSIAEPQLKAIELFHHLAAKHGVIQGTPRALKIYGQ